MNIPAENPVTPEFAHDRTLTEALGVIRFGPHPTHSNSLCIQPGLSPLPGQEPLVETLAAQGIVQTGQRGAIRYASDGVHLLAALELRADVHGGLEACTEQAYRSLLEFNRHSGYPHVLRMWNYMDHINHGLGDAENYRRFCMGRARALAGLPAEQYPAATAIGRQQATGLLLVYWLAARRPGIALENPRQMSAWRYPRDYGPASPSFARACLTQEMLLISGTASIVGHATQHTGDVVAQTHETINNLEALIAHARQRRPELPARPDHSTLLKVYVRHAGHAQLILDTLRGRCGDAPRILLLGADICRRDLLLEIDGAHGLAT